MMFGFVTKRRLERELAAERAAGKAETDRLRERAEQAEDVARTEVVARRTINAQYCALSDEHDLVVSRNTSLCAQLDELKDTASIQAQVRRQADRIAELMEEASRARADARAERRRADTLQQRLDDAVGLTGSRPLDSAPWQPANVQPTPDKEVSS